MGERQQLIRKALRLEWLTLIWMVIEAVVAISAGILAHSLLLTAFGIDSLIELVSAGVLLWRLYVELKQGLSFSIATEKLAARISGLLLFSLALYIIGVAGWKLLQHETITEFSKAGFFLTCVAIPSMFLLSRAKLKLADSLGSRSLRADAMETITCGYLSFVVIIGLAIQGITHFWWIDPVASLAIVYFLFKEGLEAWKGDACTCCQVTEV